MQEIEDFRPLLPVGYEATVVAYRKAMAQTCVADLTNHYKEGLHEFQSVFVPYLKRVLHELSGGVWVRGELGWDGDGDRFVPKGERVPV